MMRMGIFAAAGAMLLATACSGGGDTAVLVKSCVDEGTPKKDCECFIGEMKKNLDKDLYRSIVLDSQGKKEEAEKIRSDLSMEKQFSAIGVMMAAANKCNVNPLGMDS
ncbi:MAG: hypothetical protein R3C52_14915 [Hyphomonadaceae bacterium]